MAVRRENTCVLKRIGFAEHGAAGRGAEQPLSGQPPSRPHPPAGNRRQSPYLFRSDHGDHVGSLLPHHLPEVMARVRQGPLRGYVVPFRPTNHHLQTKDSIDEATSSPGSAGPGQATWVGAITKTPKALRAHGKMQFKHIFVCNPQ